MLKNFIKSNSNFHLKSKGESIFVYATPRGGSTWFMEMIWSQPGFKCINEPFNIRNLRVKKALGIASFSDLYNQKSPDKILKYLHDLSCNKIRFLNPSPLRRNYRLLTTNLVFKIIHLNLKNLNWLVENLGARVVLVLRHPIPVSISREVFPLLDDFSNCALREEFSNEQKAFIDRVALSGTHLEKGVTAWCIHNRDVIKNLGAFASLVTYEQAILEPRKIIKSLCQNLDLPYERKMLDQSYRASAVKRKSTKENQKLLEGLKSRELLINSWRSNVSETEEMDLMSILDLFEIDVYKYGRDCALDNYLL